MKSRKKIKTERLGIVVKGDLVPGIKFPQDTKSGDRLILVWSPPTDRLYRWDVRSQTWIQIKSDAISSGKKQQLAKFGDVA